MSVSVNKRARSAGDLLNSDAHGAYDKLITPAVPAVPISSVLNNTTDTFVVNDIGSGPNAYERVGRRVAMDRLDFVVPVYHVVQPLPAAGLLSGNTLRISVVHDNIPGATIPMTWNRIFALISSVDGSRITAFDAPLNPQNSQRFTVLHDEFIDFNPTVTTAVAPEISVEYHTLVRSVDLQGLTALYDTDPTVDNPSQGALYVLYKSRLTVATPELPGPPIVPATNANALYFGGLGYPQHRLFFRCCD